MRKLPPSTAQLVMVLAALVVGYFVFTAAGDILRSHRLNRSEERIQSEIAELQRQHQELESLRGYLQTDDYIEYVARRVLGLVRPGETLVVVGSSATPEPEPDRDDLDRDHPWWRSLGGP